MESHDWLKAFWCCSIYLKLFKQFWFLATETAVGKIRKVMSDWIKSWKMEFEFQVCPCLAVWLKVVNLWSLVYLCKPQMIFQPASPAPCSSCEGVGKQRVRESLRWSPVTVPIRGQGLCFCLPGFSLQARPWQYFQEVCCSPALITSDHSRGSDLLPEIIWPRAFWLFF